MLLLHDIQGIPLTLSKIKWSIPYNISICQRKRGMLTLVENYFLHEHLLVMSSRSAKYGAFSRTCGRGTSRPRYALQYRQLELLQGIAQYHCTQVIMIVHERMLELNCFYSLLCLTKIIFLQSSLNIHLIMIATSASTLRPVVWPM